MKEILSNPNLVAYCGLYCGACKSYLKERCPGCHDNEKARWCKIRPCCMDNQYALCADCKQFSDPNDCKLFNNFMSKVFAFISQEEKSGSVLENLKGPIAHSGFQRLT